MEGGLPFHILCLVDCLGVIPDHSPGASSHEDEEQQADCQRPSVLLDPNDSMFEIAEEMRLINW
jgi:hypothetical protein